MPSGKFFAVRHCKQTSKTDARAASVIWPLHAAPYHRVRTRSHFTLPPSLIPLSLSRANNFPEINFVCRRQKGVQTATIKWEQQSRKEELRWWKKGWVIVIMSVTASRVAIANCLFCVWVNFSPKRGNLLHERPVLISVFNVVLLEMCVAFWLGIKNAFLCAKQFVGSGKITVVGRPLVQPPSLCLCRWLGVVKWPKTQFKKKLRTKFPILNLSTLYIIVAAAISCRSHCWIVVAAEVDGKFVLKEKKISRPLSIVLSLFVCGVVPVSVRDWICLCLLLIARIWGSRDIKFTNTESGDEEEKEMN